MKLTRVQIEWFWAKTALVMMGCCLISAACQWASYKTAAVEPVFTLAVNLPDGDLRRTNRLIRQYVAEMTDEVRRSILGIFCVADKNHYGKYRNSDGNQIEVDGHHHDGIVCLKPETVSNATDVLDHEATHAYHRHLRSNGSDFDKKWRPGHGITWYALDAQKTTSDFKEDVAEWVLEFKRYVRGKFSVLAYLQWNSNFRHNLYLLREYKFVRESEFREFLKKNPRARKP